MLGCERDVEVTATHRTRERLVLAFGVYHNNIGIKHQTPQNLELGKI